MTEPKYSKAEQREHMREFERMVTRARKDWRRGYAVVLLSFRDYLRLDSRASRRRKAEP